MCVYVAFECVVLECMHAHACVYTYMMCIFIYLSDALIDRDYRLIAINCCTILSLIA
jgi:hypothetical protein